MSIKYCEFCNFPSTQELHIFGQRNHKYSGWISAKDRLPENQIVLALTTAARGTYPHQFISFYSHDTETWCDILGFVITTDSRVLKDCKLQVTHWMPLPDAPEDKP